MSMAAVTTRKPGRPRGAGRHNATCRFSPDVYAALQKSAGMQGRSVSEEVEVRVAKSFSDQEVRETLERNFEKLESAYNEIRELMDKVIAKHQARTEKLQQQITDLQQERLRDLTNSNALAEKLFQQIVDLQKERALNEARLAQIIEDAVAQALARRS